MRYDGFAQHASSLFRCIRHIPAVGHRYQPELMFEVDNSGYESGEGQRVLGEQKLIRFWRGDDLIAPANLDQEESREVA